MDTALAQRIYVTVMKKLLLPLALVATASMARAATTNIGPWTPLFQGVEIAYARVFGGSGERTEAINCLRIDLANPEIQLFTTPKCTNCSAQYETLADFTSHFLEQYGVQVAVNGGFYASSLGPNDVPVGTPENVYGLAISQGTVVSPQDSGVYAATMLFSSNNVPTFVPRNWPPRDSNGYYTAVTGNIILLTNGVNAGTNVTDNDPRTAIGISQDRRYLFMMTVDGRQGILFGVNPPWSDGLNFYETADWLARFGAWDGMNVDGGGSTTMCMADCQGKSVRLNSSSFVKYDQRERNIAQNFGVYARPLPSDLLDLTVEPGTTTALIRWRTEAPATTQAEYGLTTSYGSATPLDARLLKNHVLTISGLAAGSNYSFRALSATAGGQQYTQACSFATLGAVVSTSLFGLTNAWRYSTNNFDSQPLWKTRTYDDSGWAGPNLGCLHIESSNPPMGQSFPPRSTLLPPGNVNPIFRTYYFRTRFNFSGTTSGVSLVFSNYVDDGAVFYLNGAEVNRLRMAAAPTSILNSTYANNTPCQGQPQVGAGDALTICPDVFPVSGNLVTNLVEGENVVAVEVHNYTSGADILFGSALFANRPVVVSPELHLWTEGAAGTLFWNGEGFTLQQSPDPVGGNWSDVPGPVTRSPYALTPAGTMFYRLRN